MLIEPSRLAYIVSHLVVLNDALPRPDAPDRADAALLAAQHLLLHDEALLAVSLLDDARRPVAEFRVDVMIPQVERLEDVAIGIDDVVGAGHRHFLRGELSAAD